MRIRSDSMMRWATRPVTNVSPISTSRSARVISRKTADATNSTASDPADTPWSIPVLTSTGPASVASPSRTTSTKPTSSGRRNSLSSRGRLKPRSWRDSLGKVDRREVLDRLQSGDPGQQLRSRRQVEAPAAPAAAAESGADARCADRAGAGAGAASVLRSSVPSGRGRSSGGDQRGQGLDAVAQLLGDLFLETGQQGAVGRAAPHELFVGALLDDPSVIEDDDPVGQMQGRATVGDEQRGAIGHDPAEGVVDGLLDLGVDGAGGVVEDEDPGVVQDGPGQSDALALAAGEGEPPFAHHGVVAAGERLDELGGLGRLAAADRTSSSVASGRP